MYVVTVSAFSLWIIYGLMIASIPIVAFNVTSLLLSGSILLMKLRHASATSGA
jgi:MtN3 and saliva related transmembrane protein